MKRKLEKMSIREKSEHSQFAKINLCKISEKSPFAKINPGEKKIKKQEWQSFLHWCYDTGKYSVASCWFLERKDIVVWKRVGWFL